ncbi:MAG: Asp23/Gls24 family envelope stress response protein [Firmicutes bacterium]|nr:Asp23/Gls24 family envelope stress response protein [Bacillota bacterium]
MSLTKVTNLGAITINSSVISKEVINAAIPVNEKMFFSTEKGKLLGAPKKVGLGDLTSNIKIVEDGEKLDIKIYIVMNFGSSIKTATETILDNLQKSLCGMFPRQNITITIKIVGVKSKNIALRDIEVIREYEASR